MSEFKDQENVVVTLSHGTFGMGRIVKLDSDVELVRLNDGTLKEFHRTKVTNLTEFVNQQKGTDQ